MKKKVLSLFLVAVLLLTSVSLAFADSYTVKSGDVLWKIAQKYNTTWQKLAEINKLKNPNLIFPGQVINLEGQTAVTPATPATPAKTDKVLSTDVVVVGAGGTGLAAAASAYLNGADVIVLEKLAQVGGSTARSGGGIGATDTRFQREKGIVDTKDSWMELWKERQNTSNPGSKYPDYSRVDKFMDEAVVTTEWLVDVIGHKYGSVEGFGMDPAPRLHFPAPVGNLTGGAALIKNIETFVKSKGINILLETPATELVTDAAGNVTGVIANSKDGKVTINAKKVILAAGGFAQSEELLKRFTPRMAGTAALSYAAPGSTGDGILMAEKIGAALYEDPWVIGLGIGEKVTGGTSLMMDWTKVYVNEKGERFTSEQTHYALATNKVAQQQTPWLILDSTKANADLVKSIEAKLPTSEAVKANSIEELAKAMGVPADTLVKTINTYNSGATAAVDAVSSASEGTDVSTTTPTADAFGKDPQYIVPVKTAPYYAIKIYPKTMGTFGGVKTNDNYQVLRADGSIINNLYAGGECANRVIYNQVYMSGSSVQFALTSGRLAGQHAAQSLKEKVVSTDVVVVGAGGTGLSAAASAYLNGADVIVLEKQAQVGGSTARSGGGIGATNTRFQREKGITDTKESWMNLWKERQATSNPGSKYPDYSRVDKFMDEAVVTTEWLVDAIGHQYGAVEGYGMDPEPRLHFPAPVGSLTSGAALIKNIETFVRGKGINIMLETPATELVVDAAGNVTGVVAKSKDGTVRINAKKVILAAGGFANSEDLLKRFVPRMAGTSQLTYAAPGSTGDGILMAEKAGAALYEDPWVIGLGIGEKVTGGTSLMMDWTKVYVNEKGERFTSEQTHYALATNKVAQQQTPWLILDSTEANAKIVAACETKLSTGEAVKADTFEGLAKAMGVPADTLAKTMADYNTGAKSGKDALGKEAKYTIAVEKAPYYAIKIYPKTMGTFGGVKTNENYQVLRADGSIINNLYAGGECANRVIYNQVYMSGSSVQFALTSGRLAGQHAAKSAK